MLPRGAINPCSYNMPLFMFPSLQAVGQAAAPSQPPHPARGGRRSRRRRPSYGAAGRRGRGRRATAVEAAVALALPAQPAGHGCRRVSQQVSSPCISDRPLKRIIHVCCDWEVDSKAACSQFKYVYLIMSRRKITSIFLLSGLICLILSSNSFQS